MAASQSLMVTVGSEQQNLLALNLELFSRSTQLLSPTSTDHSTKVSQPGKIKQTFPKAISNQSKQTAQSQYSHRQGYEVPLFVVIFAFPTGREEKVPHSAKSDS